MRVNDIGDVFHDEQMERGFLEITGKFADGKDKCYLYTGLFCAFLFGASIPIFFYLFGLLVDELGQSTSIMNYEFSKLNEICYITMILGVVVFIVSFGQILFSSYFADSIASKMSIAYFEKSLKQDVAFYDRQSSKKIVERLKDEITIVRQGLGENYAYAVQSFTVFLVGFIVAFIRGWLLTLLALPGFPVIIFIGLKLAGLMSEQAEATARSYSRCMGLSY